MHGGRSTGPRTADGIARLRTARTIHGHYSAEARARRRHVLTMLRRGSVLLDALRYGAPPHGGIAVGMDRLAMLLSGADSLRDVIPFPKTQRGTDLMTDAPNKATPDQLAELKIRVIEPAP